MSNHEVANPTTQVESIETPGTAVYDAIEKIELSTDLDSRVKEVATLRGSDLIAYTALLHSVLAPEADINPTPNAMHVSSPNGSDKRKLVSPEERAEIFEKTANLITSLGRDIKPEAQQAFLERAGNLAALSVVLAHPYEDGNGRTARVLAHLIREGFDGSDQSHKDIETLGSNRPAQGFRINSYLPTMTGNEISPIELLEVAASTNLPLAAIEIYRQSTRSEFTTPYT